MRDLNIIILNKVAVTERIRSVTATFYRRKVF